MAMLNQVNFWIIQSYIFKFANNKGFYSMKMLGHQMLAHDEFLLINQSLGINFEIKRFLLGFCIKFKL
jgi:hypothetical protein